MIFRGGEFSTGEMGNFHSASTEWLVITPVAVEKVPKLSFLLLTAPCKFLILRRAFIRLRGEKEFFNSHSLYHK
jgi:hypothetical protein